ncbi:MAG: energy transducer TonB [Deltaproteobacteria bacterium]|nr:energy transducer TonB [Deltaproteobacteria bacterium]
MASGIDLSRERASSSRGALLVALAISLVSHIALVTVVTAISLLRPPAPANRAAAQIAAVQVQRIPAERWQSNRAVRGARLRSEDRPPAPLPPAAPPVEPDESRPPGQVVALPPPERSERPRHADYASEHDRAVERETRSRYQTPDFLNPAHRLQSGDQVKRDVPSTTEPRPPQAAVLKVEGSGGPAGEGQSAAGNAAQGTGAAAVAGRQPMELAIPRLEQRDRLELALDTERGQVRNRSYSERLAGNSDHLALRLGPRRSDPSASAQGGATGRAGGSGGSGVGIAALTPDLSTIERLSGAPANDHLPNVEEDDGTFLNTWRWKHAPFFNRIADSIRRSWNPGPEIARRDPSGNIYGFQDRFTLLKVTIDKQGTITEINVAESCGVDFLDREAVLAFRRAEPFPNPPPRMFGGHGTYTFFFGFNVDFQTSPLIDFRWRAMP